jgi:3'-phosphoadenosine 5'-phosphosulfate (PAPS) 3'-phosphatase
MQEQRSEWQEYWLVDPLDGTQDFLEQTGEFCICIAYIKNHQAIFGLVYAPLTQTNFELCVELCPMTTRSGSVAEQAFKGV